jgi:hypothetical protein
VLGDLLKRLVNLFVLALAALAFFSVKVGGKTPFQHVVAVAKTPPARQAAAAFADVAREAARRAAREIAEARQSP